MAGGRSTARSNASRPIPIGGTWCSSTNISTATRDRAWAPAIRQDGRQAWRSCCSRAATGSGRTRELGTALLEAQIVEGVVTQGLKHAVHRTRPDGGHNSFPSGHTSASFATADVLWHRFGWKAGLPAYAGAVYISASRMA